MPGGDRKGPFGRGPMTGWGRGYCGGLAHSSVPDNGMLRGAGQGGRGRGHRHRFFAAGLPGWAEAGTSLSESKQIADSPEDRIQAEGERLQEELENIKKRLSDLESAKERSE